MTKTLQSSLEVDLPVLFVYIGWTYYYDGTEKVQGGHGFLQKISREDTSEAFAFRKRDDGFLRCGIGGGSVPHKRLHAVFLARDPRDGKRKVVGLYAAALVESDPGWSRVKSSPSQAARIPHDQRPTIPLWPAGQGMRRWAWRGGSPGSEHPTLQRYFNTLRTNILVLCTEPTFDQTYTGLEALEGQQQRRLRNERKREHKLREAKIQATLNRKGRLVCEVPGCGFDFRERYGDLGDSYAHVHHLQPLAHAKDQGEKHSPQDLAIVCANCHAMIHRGGECRPMKSLIPKSSRAGR